MRFPWAILKDKNELPRYAMFPFFLSYAAALLERDGFEVFVLDGVPLNLDDQEFIGHVFDVQPDVIVFEPNTAGFSRTLDLISRIKAFLPEAWVILCGSHSTYFSKDILKNHQEVDLVIKGEYEMTLMDTCNHYRLEKEIKDLPGLCVRKGEEIIENPDALAIDLMELPVPARHHFPSWFNNDMSLYFDGFVQHRPAFHMHTSRGCPFRCNFCDRIQLLYKNGKQRFFTPGRIVDEMILLQREFGAREIYIDDDNFTSNRQHVLDLCKEIKDRGLNISWSAMADTMVLSPEMLEEMKDAGCVGIKFGLDSSDKEVLKKIKKPLRTDQLELIIEKSKSLGIKTHMSVVFGLSGETKETLRSTFDYSCKVDVDSVQFSLATPCPGTSFYEELKAENRLRFNSWEEFDGANTTVIHYDDFSKEYLERFMSQAHSAWLRRKFMKPFWVLRQFRYLPRIIKSQGIQGLRRRANRAIGLLRGDASQILFGKEKKFIRV